MKKLLLGIVFVFGCAESTTETAPVATAPQKRYVNPPLYAFNDLLIFEEVMMARFNASVKEQGFYKQHAEMCRALGQQALYTNDLDKIIYHENLQQELLAQLEGCRAQKHAMLKITGTIKCKKCQRLTHPMVSFHAEDGSDALSCFASYVDNEWIAGCAYTETDGLMQKYVNELTRKSRSW